MTIVVADAGLGIMASDTEGVGGYVSQAFGSKIVRRRSAGGGDVLIGYCGDYLVDRWARGIQDCKVETRGDVEALWDTYMAQAEERKQVKDGNAQGSAMVLARSGLYLCEADGSVLIPENGWSAIGSGKEAALAVMYVANDPALAATIAVKLNIYCGGPVVTEWLEKPKGA